MRTLAVRATNDVRESGVFERRAKRPFVVEELMPPPSERAIQRETRLHFLRFGHAQAVVRDPDPIEIGGGEPKHAIVAKHPAAFAEQSERIGVCEMFDEVLCEYEGDI